MRRFCLPLLLLALVIVLSIEESQASRALRGYQERIKAMREAINARESSVASSSVSKSSKSNPQKTKKYKCVLVEEEDDESASPEEPKTTTSTESPDFDYGVVPAAPTERNNQLWPATNSLPKHSLKQHTLSKQFSPSRSAVPAEPTALEFPKAKAMPQVKPLPVIQTLQQPPVVTTVRPNIPTDKNHQPLILSPQHCEQIRYYANMYGVEDVDTWVHKNCAFAKMYLPKATCDEIDVLVASCNLR